MPDVITANTLDLVTFVALKRPTIKKLDELVRIYVLFLTSREKCDIINYRVKRRKTSD